MLLNQLLDSLSETERELIEMRYFQDKTQTEVAGGPGNQPGTGEQAGEKNIAAHAGAAGVLKIH